MPVLSWSLGCQPEYGQLGPSPTPPTPAAAPPARGQQTHRQRQQPRGKAPAIQGYKTLPVPRKGPRTGQVRARSDARAPHLAQSCRHGDPGPTSREGPTGPTLRANPCPEVTDLDCRFPLPTLIYRLEAPNLGDRMRRWVQSVSKLCRRRGCGPRRLPKGLFLCGSTLKRKHSV